MLPGHLPRAVKDLLSHSLVEQTMRETDKKFRALAEATFRPRREYRALHVPPVRDG